MHLLVCYLNKEQWMVQYEEERCLAANTSTLTTKACSKSIRPLAGKNTFTRLDVCNPNPLQSSLLVTEHTSPSGSAIVRSISGMPVCEWSTT